MDPLTMAGISFGCKPLEPVSDFMGQQEGAKQNNKAIKARNQYAVAQRAYGEQIKDFEYKNALKIYAMRQEQSKLEIQEYQMLIRITSLMSRWHSTISSIMLGYKLYSLTYDLPKPNHRPWDQPLHGALRGVEQGVGVSLAQNAIMAGMEGVQRARQLAMAEERADMRIGRAAQRLTLCLRCLSIVSVLVLNVHLQHLQHSWKLWIQVPLPMGLFSGLASNAASAFGVYSSLKAPTSGNITVDRGSGWDMSNHHFWYACL